MTETCDFPLMSDDQQHLLPPVDDLHVHQHYLFLPVSSEGCVSLLLTFLPVSRWENRKKVPHLSEQTRTLFNPFSLRKLHKLSEWLTFQCIDSFSLTLSQIPSKTYDLQGHTLIPAERFVWRKFSYRWDFSFFCRVFLDKPHPSSKSISPHPPRLWTHEDSFVLRICNTRKSPYLLVMIPVHTSCASRTTIPPFGVRSFLQDGDCDLNVSFHHHKIKKDEELKFVSAFMATTTTTTCSTLITTSRCC